MTDNNKISEFNKIYENQVLPILEELEEKRKKEIGKVCLKCILAIIFISILGLGAIFYTGDDGYNTFMSEAVILIIFSIFLICAAILLNTYRKFKSKLKENLFPILLKKFGNIEAVNDSPKKFKLFTKDELYTSGLFAPFDEYSVSYGFMGIYKNISFRFAPILMRVLILTRVQQFVKFKGIILSFKTGKKTKERTIIATKDSNTIMQNDMGSHTLAFLLGLLIIFCFFHIFYILGAVENKFFIRVSDLMICILPILLICFGVYNLIQDIKNVRGIAEIGDETLPNNLNIYSTDKEEGERIIKSPLGQKILNLKAPYDAKNIRYSFFDDNLMIAMETNKNLFEIGSLFHTLLDPKPIENFCSEINSVYEMLDYLKIEEENSNDGQ